jgi:hypothetical protein
MLLLKDTQTSSMTMLLLKDTQTTPQSSSKTKFLLKDTQTTPHTRSMTKFLLKDTQSSSYYNIYLENNKKFVFLSSSRNLSYCCSVCPSAETLSC